MSKSLKPFAGAVLAASLLAPAGLTVAADETVTPAPTPVTAESGSTVTSALTTQTTVVADTHDQADQVQATAIEADQAVASAQAEVDAATQALATAQADVDNATSENIEAVKTAQADNLAKQETNATATDAVNAEIKDQTGVVASKKTDVDTAQVAKDQADADLASKQAAVKSAEDALNGVGLEEAQANLGFAEDAIVSARTGLWAAEISLERAKANDAKRESKVSAAETDVKVKTDAVDTAKMKVTAATADVNRLEELVATTTASTENREQAILDWKLSNSGVNIIPFSGFDNMVITKNYSRDDYAFLQTKIREGALDDIDPKVREELEAQQKKEDEYYNSYLVPLMKEIDSVLGESELNSGSNKDTAVRKTPTFTEADKTRWVDVRNMSFEDMVEINELGIRLINGLRRKYAYMNDKLDTWTPSKITTESIKNVQSLTKAYMDKYMDGGFRGHDLDILSKHHSVAENIFSTNMFGDLPGSLTNFEERPDHYHWTMAELKSKVVKEIYEATVNDIRYTSAWGHANHNLTPYPQTSFGFTITDRTTLHLHTVSTVLFGDDSDKYHLTNESYIEALKKEFEEKFGQTSDSDITQIQSALTKAKETLAKASADYATALELKTQAEKVLAELTTPSYDTQVAENNVRLMTIALADAQARQAEVQAIIDNFSADSKTKQQALTDAKTAFATAQATQEAKAVALNEAQSVLADEQAKLEVLIAKQTELLAEKDALVAQAKELAEQLNRYVNADSNLVDAKTKVIETETKLTEAKDAAVKAHAELDEINAKLADEKAKLAELQAKEDALKGGQTVKLPNGQVLQVGKTGAKKGSVAQTGRPVGKGKTSEVATPTGTYSRVERAKTLPETGEESSWFALTLGLLASGLGLVGLSKKKGN